MIIFLIMLVQALPVYIVARVFKNGTFVTLTAIIMAVLAIATGRSVYTAIDLFGIGVAYWIGLMHLGAVKAAAPAKVEPSQSSDDMGVKPKPIMRGPSDLLNLSETDFITALSELLGRLSEHERVMLLVAYTSQKILVETIESREAQGTKWPKTLDELIRVTDPFANKTPDEVAASRRYWFTVAGLLIRAERMAVRGDATELCVTVWISLVQAAQIIPETLGQDTIWSNEEIELLTLGIAQTAAECARTVHDTSVPEFVKNDARMQKTYYISARGMSEEDWVIWQIQKLAKLNIPASAPMQKDERAILIGGIVETSAKIIEKEGRTEKDAQFLAIVALLDDLRIRPNGQSGAKLVIDIARREYAQHFNDVLMYIAWRDGKVLLKPEIERRLISRLSIAKDGG